MYIILLSRYGDKKHKEIYGITFNINEENYLIMSRNYVYKNSSCHKKMTGKRLLHLDLGYSFVFNRKPVTWGSSKIEVGVNPDILKKIINLLPAEIIAVQRIKTSIKWNLIY